MTTPPVQSDENPDDPNPARSSATLAAFTGQVQRRIGLETQSEAEVLVRATLNELGKAISSGLAQDLTVSLPPELSAELRAQRPKDDQARSVTKDAFVDAVSGRVTSVDAEKVEHQVEQVLHLLREWLPEDQVDRTLEQLPGDLVALVR
ncbi:DUF2267 domain-containing protein [Actinomycetospora callitridis]|jgi:uncharacterized protein (DUF2267 family)|uniref:DUF2267 domain-containing protein n=1 Tax=Actinomycetospora callitridis TaxID=913944 RepID=UPI002366578B|nr:DUF2267 domain-containing protein [Actinomycetospora callitridis]MDD7919504.1 DUF2267 domain-containing protein [Actinomycetospora callitridis]